MHFYQNKHSQSDLTADPQHTLSSSYSTVTLVVSGVV